MLHVFDICFKMKFEMLCGFVFALHSGQTGTMLWSFEAAYRFSSRTFCCVIVFLYPPSISLDQLPYHFRKVSPHHVAPTTQVRIVFSVL